MADGTLKVGTITTSSGSGTITLGQSGETLNVGTGVVSRLGKFESQLLHVRDEKASDVGGGTFTAGAWRTRTLNTVVTNEITGASLSSNQITLPSGTYYIDASAPAYVSSRHKVVLYNITDSAFDMIGTSEFNTNGSAVVTRSFVKGRFTISAQKTFELQHHCETTDGGNGLGVKSIFGQVCVYAEVQIWRTA